MKVLVLSGSVLTNLTLELSWDVRRGINVKAALKYGWVIVRHITKSDYDLRIILGCSNYCVEYSLNMHGWESRDVNDRVHGISCRYSDKTSTCKQVYHFS